MTSTYFILIMKSLGASVITPVLQLKKWDIESQIKSKSCNQYIIELGLGIASTWP